MVKRYERTTDEVVRKIASLREQYYGGKKDPFEIVTIGAMFVFDWDAPDEPILTHRGYPAVAVARVVRLRDRAAGLPDAQIIIDRATWASLTAPQQIAVLDHELYHFELVYDNKGNLKYDSHARPKLRIRKHDWEFGLVQRDCAAAWCRRDRENAGQAARRRDGPALLRLHEGCRLGGNRCCDYSHASRPRKWKTRTTHRIPQRDLS